MNTSTKRATGSIFQRFAQFGPITSIESIYNVKFVGFIPDLLKAPVNSYKDINVIAMTASLVINPPYIITKKKTGNNKRADIILTFKERHLLA